MPGILANLYANCLARPILANQMASASLKEQDQNRTAFVAVHIGAGEYSASQDPAYRKIISDACLAGMKLLKNDHTALEVAKSMIKFLEDCPQTNAGIGSNLTNNGIVECDASIMDGATHQFAGVGAVPRTTDFLNSEQANCSFRRP